LKILIILKIFKLLIYLILCVIYLF